MRELCFGSISTPCSSRIAGAVHMLVASKIYSSGSQSMKLMTRYVQTSKEEIRPHSTGSTSVQ